MNIVYTATEGWQLVPVPEDGQHYVGALTGADPFPSNILFDIDDNILDLENGCKLWIGGAHYRTRPNALPYYLNKYVSAFPRQISARQLLIARHLNVHFMNMTSFRVGMTCTTPSCVHLEHMIPYTFFPRTKLGKLAAPEVVIPRKELSDEEKEQVRRSVLDAVKREEKPATNSQEAIMKILGNRGRTYDQLTPEEKNEVEKRTRKVKSEEPTTLDEIGVPTTKPHK